ncbi:MAG: hypothetical protein AUI10_07770 [Actinobacteria bacterium 13_2_20CM_2_72_6]|nr:MAG: hypothetical protein AUI10_07770 [Actinobacteria bacterium 13_2_20CM_2_72_6]
MACSTGARRIVAEARGTRYEARLAHWSVNPAFTVFWVDHPGVPLPDATAYPRPTGPTEHATFFAYDAAGHQLATSGGITSKRSDIGVNLQDAPRIGELIETGLRLASGGMLVFRFVGTDNSVLLKAAGRDPATGTVTDLKDLSALHLPLSPAGFYNGMSDLAGPGGTQIMVGEYVGTAARVEGGAPGAAVTSGSAHWSAHPEMIVFWVANVAPAVAAQTGAVAYDAANKIVGTYSGR